MQQVGDAFWRRRHFKANWQSVSSKANTHKWQILQAKKRQTLTNDQQNCRGDKSREKSLDFSVITKFWWVYLTWCWWSLVLFGIVKSQLPSPIWLTPWSSSDPFYKILPILASCIINVGNKLDVCKLCSSTTLKSTYRLEDIKSMDSWKMVKWKKYKIWKLISEKNIF